MNIKADELTSLFPIQEKLDDKIALNHPIQDGEDRLKSVNVALLVELGEAMNEWRKFKFWSTDRQPRTKAWCRTCRGTGEIWVDDFKKDCFDCDENFERDYLLEELVDCLHFILSIGLRLRVHNQIFLNPFIYEQDVEATFLQLNKIDWTYDYDRAFDLFIGFCQLLGYSPTALYYGYLAKNKINHNRQEQGY